MTLLFAYETPGYRALWEHGSIPSPHVSHSAMRYAEAELDTWFANKRPFTRNELTKSTWYKANEYGQQYVAR
jgi:hypothetical protein